LVKEGGGYKVVRNPETQNYAVKDGHVIIYDDEDSIKAKVLAYLIPTI